MNNRAENLNFSKIWGRIKEKEPSRLKE